MPNIIDQYFEDHNADIHFFYTGKQNIVGRDYADSVIINRRNAHYIRIATLSYDTSLQSIEENIVNEEIMVRVENSVGSQYLANQFRINLIGHIVGRRVNKNKFKCIVTPDIEYLDFPRILITEELSTEGNRIGIWMHTEGIKTIYLSKIYSHARNSLPMNTGYLDSKYYIHLLQDEEMVYDVDTTNIIGVVTRNQFLAGINVYDGINKRLSKLEDIRYPDIQYATVNTDISWTPVVEGATGRDYQRIPVSTADYGISMSNPFIRILTGDTKGFTVTEKGLYQIQIVSGLNTRSAIEDSNVELSLFKNSEKITSSEMRFKLRADNGVNYTNPIGVSGINTLLQLNTSDIMRLQMKFLSEPKNGVVNDGCKLAITKLLQIPE